MGTSGSPRQHFSFVHATREHVIVARVSFRSLAFVVLLVSSASARASETGDAALDGAGAVDEDPGHLVVLSDGWMPSVRLGYRVQGVRLESRGTSQREVGHGFTSDVLVPLVASGERSSHARLALAVGAGLDFVGGDAGFVEPPVWMLGPRAPGRSVVVYGQLGAILRWVGRHADLVGSLLWLPGRWIEIDGIRVAVWERGRVSLGMRRGFWQLDVFAGLAALGASTRMSDFGLRVGAGW